MTFPLLLPSYDKEIKSYGIVPFTSIPWELIEQHASQCLSNHYQSPKRLSERGGLHPHELAAVLEDRPWKRIPLEEAFKIIQRFL